MIEIESQFRPCRGCRNDFHECTCNREEALVIRKLQCPYCGEEFKTAIIGRHSWLQRCGYCLRTFDAVDESVTSFDQAGK